MNISINDFFKYSFIIYNNQEEFENIKKIFTYHNLLISDIQNIFNNEINNNYDLNLIIKFAQQHNFPYICIFNQTCYPRYDIKNFIEYYINDIPNDCDCLILGNNGIIKYNKYNNKYIQISYIENIYACIIFRNSYIKILNSNINITKNKIINTLKYYSPVQNLYIQFINNKYIWIKHSEKEIFSFFPKIFDILNPDIKQRKKVIAMASFPPRKEGMISAIKQLLPQCDDFYLWLNEYEKIPEELKQFNQNKLHITLSKVNLKDNGRYTFIEQNKDAYFFVCDDDIDWPSDYIEHTIKCLNIFNNNKIISYFIHSEKDCFNECKISRIANIQSLGFPHFGSGMMAFVPEKIKYYPTIEELEKLYDIEVLFGYYCNTNNIDVIFPNRRKQYINWKKINNCNLMDQETALHHKSWERVKYTKKYYFEKYKKISNNINNNIKIINITQFSNGNNYGQRLQTYALQKFIKKYLNYDIFTINHSSFFQNKFHSNFAKKFETNYMNILTINSWNDLKNINFNLCIVGGDQCFHFTHDIDTKYYNGLLFKEPHTINKIISFSSSEGDYINYKLDDNKKKNIYNLLNFNKLSFREKKSSEQFNNIINNIFNNKFKSTYNIDPVFLLTSDEWLQISKKPIFINNNQIFDFTYICSNNKNKIEEKDGIKNYYYYGNNNNQNNIDPQEFLWMLKHCRNFTTNSFHGFAFSLIFQKNNINLLKNDIRIQDLKNILNIKYKNNTIINFYDISQNIEFEKKRSYKYLYNSLNELIFEKTKYCAYIADQNLRNKSSSGGVSAVFARQILDENGIVYGASYSNDFKKVQTISIDNIDDYYKYIAGSKYNFCFLPKLKSIKEQLDKEIKILFTGCPCQIIALKKYLKHDYNNLITVDLLCNGYSKPKYLKEFIDKIEIENLSKVIDLKMRTSHQSNLYISFENGNKQNYGNITTKYFVCNKQQYMNMCKTCNLHIHGNNQSDITIGDFWDFNKYKNELQLDQQFNPKLGSSIVYINTLKGQIFFEKIKSKIIFKELI